jgi:hypothetical protein
VNTQGAAAGRILCGCGLNNLGLRLRILQEQKKGHDGPIQGRFVIPEVGANLHAEALRPLLQQETDAAEVVGLIREAHSGCVSPVNANVLVPEPAEQPDRPVPGAAGR